jgi:hypothetical protein
VKAGNPRNTRDLLKRQLVSQMAFDKPERFLGRIHGITNLIASTPIMTAPHALRLTVLAAVRGFAEPALRSTIFRTAENNN